MNAKVAQAAITAAEDAVCEALKALQTHLGPEFDVTLDTNFAYPHAEGSKPYLVRATLRSAS
jgi:hypothetical protein